MSGGTASRHTHSHHVTVSVCDPHTSAGPGHAAVAPVTAIGHPALAVACLRCIGDAVPPRPLCTSTLRSYVSQPTLTRHLSRHDVSYSCNLRSCSSLLSIRCRDSSVTKLRVGQQMNRGPIRGWGKIFSRRRVQTGSGAHPASYTIGIDSNLRGVKRPERQADHSLSSYVEIKNSRATPPLPHFSSSCSP
jgi:hypothetical protein